jgi:phospholipid/cholesterol/gamma-HCH transport system substrate-binding protein
MYASRTTQFIVGIFGVVGIIALVVLSAELGKIPLLEPPSYTLYAKFDNVSGLKTGDSVEIAGVEVGKVIAIVLNNERAKVTMQIRAGVKIDDEAIAAIKTSGIIGEKYVSVALGAGERELKNGDTVMQTESAFVLEDAIGQLINSSGTSAGGADKDKNSPGNQSKPDEKKK